MSNLLILFVKIEAGLAIILAERESREIDATPPIDLPLEGDFVVEVGGEIGLAAA